MSFPASLRPWRVVQVAVVIAGCAAAAPTDALGQPAANASFRDTSEVPALLRRAESALESGDSEGATETFERAAMMVHVPETEMGLVRSYMQAGQYRRALSFCAHVAGAHLESAAAGALYAWLLRAGGQSQFAERVLAQTLERSPHNAVALEARHAFAAPLPQTSALLLQAPHRMAPQAVMVGGQAPVPASARVVSSGVLIQGGRLALVPTAAAQSAPSGLLWVRNGLGRTTQARVADAVPWRDAFGVTVLFLDAPLDAAGPEAVSEREPFAGSPGFVFEYAQSDAATPAWPWQNQGFLGSFQSDAVFRSLGIEVADGAHGGPVLDADGHLAGIALRRPGQEAVMLPVSRWQHLLGGVNPVAPALSAQRGAPPARPSRAIPADEAYEKGLRLALQVISLR